MQRGYSRRNRFGIMTSAAESGGQFNAWSGDWILRVSGVPGSRPVAAFALDIGETWSFRRTDEPSRNTVTNGVAGETQRIGLAPETHEQFICKRAEVASMGGSFDNWAVTFQAGLRTRIMRRWPGNLKEGCARGRSNPCHPEQIIGCSDRLPFRVGHL